jgi:hypothetical protein
MTTPGPETAAKVRVMRARKESLCLACQRLILPGDYIIKLGTWQHAYHVLDRLQTPPKENTP